MKHWPRAWKISLVAASDTPIGIDLYETLL